eukprot:scaffold311928_cov17-Tisochrysis_lutea.AAC.1
MSRRMFLSIEYKKSRPARRKVPMDECFNKDPKKEKSVGPFNANAEIRNGRAAMGMGWSVYD